MLEQAQESFIVYLRCRIMQHLYIVKKMGLWHCILIHLDKDNLFFEEYRKKLRVGKTFREFLDNYGDVLSAGRGIVPHNLLQKISNSNKPSTMRLIEKEFFKVRLSREGIDENFYVLCNADKKQDMQEVTSAEEIENYGKILYSTLDDDPPEAIPIEEIIKQIFSIGRGVYSAVDRTYMMVRKGDIQNIREFLAEGGDVNCVDKHGWTMLHHAAQSGNLDMVNLLIDSSCNIHAEDIRGRKPVHIAARDSHFMVIELFLKNGVSVNDTDKNGWTLLHYATWKGNLETVRFLIHNRVEINVMDTFFGKRPIHIAAQEGHRNIVEILLQNGVNVEEPDKDGRTPFYYSVSTKQLEMAMFLLDRGANIGYAKKDGCTSLHLAAGSFTKNCETIAFLLDQGLDIGHASHSDDTALHIAGYCGVLDNVKLLIHRGANPILVNKNGQTPLTLAKENEEVASYLAVRMVGTLQGCGRHDDALKIYKELIHIQKRKLGIDDPKTLRTHFEAATMLYEQARFVDAVNILRTAHEDGLCGKDFNALYKECTLGLPMCDIETKFNETAGYLKGFFKK